MDGFHAETIKETMSNTCQLPFRASLNAQDRFTLTFELVPSRGGRSTAHERALEFARNAAADQRLKAVSITENAGGHPALSPEIMGIEIRETGLEVIIHLSCKDKNRNQMESLLFAWDREGLRNLLVITGDYPQRGYRGHPKPVFDLDSIQTLDLIGRLNCENKEGDRRNPAVKGVNPTSFCRGVAVSPFKSTEAELQLQYIKLHRKAAAGASFVITQLGYDVRKFHELLQYMEMTGLDLPVLGNVFIPTPAVTRLMVEGKIPGVIIPPALGQQWQREQQEADRGRRAALLRGAGLLAVLKGLGYAGAHIGGPGLEFSELDFMLNEAERAAGHWQELIPSLSCPPEQGYYYFLPDRDTGLNLPETTRTGKTRPSLSYQAARRVHELIFAPKAPLYNISKKVARQLDQQAPEIVAGLEHILKFPAFGCQNCGDCTLGELAFLCPQRGCAKKLLNGPCGGSRDGWCEVYPGRRKCFYIKVYNRLKRADFWGQLGPGFLPPRDWALNQSSSWLNYFLNRDHHNLKK